jgi:plastocyanin
MRSASRTSARSFRSIPSAHGFATAVIFLLLAGCSGDSPSGDSAADGTVARSPDGGIVRIVRIVQHDRGNKFDPPGLAISSGGAVRFVLTGGRPESVVFDADAATPEAAVFIREHSLDLGLLLVESGQSHEISFVGAPPGSYPFRSIPHAEQGMTGIVVVTE